MLGGKRKNPTMRKVIFVIKSEVPKDWVDKVGKLRVNTFESSAGSPRAGLVTLPNKM